MEYIELHFLKRWILSSFQNNKILNKWKGMKSNSARTPVNTWVISLLYQRICSVRCEQWYCKSAGKQPLICRCWKLFNTNMHSTDRMTESGCLMDISHPLWLLMCTARISEGLQQCPTLSHVLYKWNALWEILRRYDLGLSELPLKQRVALKRKNQKRGSMKINEHMHWMTLKHFV